MTRKTEDRIGYALYTTLALTLLAAGLTTTGANAGENAAWWTTAVVASMLAVVK